MISKERLESLWGTKTIVQIAEQLGETKQAIYYWGRHHGLTLPVKQDPDDVEEPSAAEIKARAAEVRARWTAAEHESRLVGSKRSRREWSLPTYRIGQRSGVIVMEGASE